jgi:hypothetical protein
MRFAWLAVLAACGTDRGVVPPPDPAVVYLTSTEHLTRASLALRGIRPSLADLRAVDADPGSLPGLVDRYLASREFGATIRELHNQTFLLQIEQLNYTPPPATPITDKTFTEISRSVFEEPLRLIEDIVVTDQPYTRIVTADYMMADKTVAAIWGLPHGDDEGWERTAWTDGRPAAGILSSTALFMRYRSAAFNYNRDRANAVSRGLLCHDFLDGDIQIDTSVNLADPGVVANAVENNPSCAGCHQTLDPLASYFFAFTRGPLAISGYPADLYNGTQTITWFTTNGRPPSYFGQDAPGLDGLGHAIANDPRFARCAAIHFAAYLTEVDEKDLPADWIAELQSRFVASNYNAKQLARAVVLSDRFRIAAHTDPVAAQGVVGYQRLRPQQLARMLRALTGFSWTRYEHGLAGMFITGPIDYLDDDYAGFRVLDGGIDAFYVTRPVHTMSATSTLVTRRAAYLAAQAVVAHDAAAPVASRTLFTAADVASTDDASVRAELAVLYGRIFSELVAADDPALDAELAVFRGVLASGSDATRAWTITLTGMLSDMRAVYY